MQEWTSVGPHSYRSDEYLVHWRMIEVMDESHIERLLLEVDETLRRFGRAMLLVDCSRAHYLSPAARRRYAEWLRNNPSQWRTSIFYNASGDMRVFLLLAKRAAELVSGQQSAIEIVDDEAAAYERIDQIRAWWESMALC